FIAANLGYALAAASKRKVLLIDLNQQFGDAALYVTEAKPSMTLADVCGQIARLDAAFLEASVLPVTPSFGILAASEDPDATSRVQPEHVETILRFARLSYDLVLLDIGRQIDAVAIRALDAADCIYPVLQLALPDIRDGCRLLDIFRSLGYRREHIRLLVNRYEKGGRLRLADLESALGAQVLHTLPNDYVAVTDSVNQGVPLLLQSSHSAAARSLQLLADSILERPRQHDGAGLSRLFARMFSPPIRRNA
ncbi:MAG TPA: AAA family ATPase, partial [Burkholderiaceae bacterium]